jgi:hypothetical protein
MSPRMWWRGATRSGRPKTGLTPGSETDWSGRGRCGSRTG